MAEPKEEAPAGEGKEAKPKGGNKTLIIIIIAVLVVLIAGGIGAYLFFGKSAKHAEESKKEEITEGKEGKETKEETKEGKEGKGGKGGKSTLVALDSFVLNLSERGRFLKVTMQFELTDPAGATLVADKTPQLRDAIITLVSSKSVESVSSPEGKFQLKDELLLRANQAMGKDIFKNLYFTEFVMQ